MYTVQVPLNFNSGPHVFHFQRGPPLQPSVHTNPFNIRAPVKTVSEEPLYILTIRVRISRLVWSFSSSWSCTVLYTSFKCKIILKWVYHNMQVTLCLFQCSILLFCSQHEDTCTLYMAECQVMFQIGCFIYMYMYWGIGICRTIFLFNSPLKDFKCTLQAFQLWIAFNNSSFFSPFEQILHTFLFLTH